MAIDKIRTKLRKLGTKERAQVSQRFFKTGPGEYGEGDIFLGIKVPELRKLAREYQDIPLPVVRQLLKSAVHEERLFALIVLVQAYAKGNESVKERIYELYLKHTRFVNNWDLVDTSAEHIVGHFLVNRSREPLYGLAQSPVLWERRIAILSTFHFVKHHEFAQTLKISKMLLSDEEDLIHKATGWMLREVGKRDLQTEERFLKRYYKKMPRTMLRYAIEKFPEPKRQRYLKGKI
ncbi:MAG: DNA alkylation repair protein [Deltaproteobacteria bacterium]|nr:DNA alkylation repair protein [Deltaproteobacteria bacterium]